MSYNLLTIETQQLTIVKDLQQKFFSKKFFALDDWNVKSIKTGCKTLVLDRLLLFMQKHLQDVCLNVGGIRGARLHDAPGPQRCTVFCQWFPFLLFNHLTSALSPLIIIIDTLLPETQKQTQHHLQRERRRQSSFSFFHACRHVYALARFDVHLAWLGKVDVIGIKLSAKISHLKNVVYKFLVVCYTLLVNVCRRSKNK